MLTPLLHTINVTVLDLESTHETMTAQTVVELVQITSSVHTLITRRFGWSSQEIVSLTRALCTNSSITHLDLGNIDHHPDAIQSIAHLLETNSTIHHISMFQSGEDDPSICPRRHQLCTHLVKAIGCSKTLDSLSIGQEHVDDPTDRAIRAMLFLNTSMTRLCIMGQDFHDEKFIRPWQAMQVNTSLARFSVPTKQIRYNRYLERLFPYLRSNVTIQYIGLERNLLTVDDIPCGAAWPTHTPFVVNITGNRLHRHERCCQALMKKLEHAARRALLIVVSAPGESTPAAIAFAQGVCMSDLW